MMVVQTRGVEMEGETWWNSGCSSKAELKGLPTDWGQDVGEWRGRRTLKVFGPSSQMPVLLFLNLEEPVGGAPWKGKAGN